MSATRLNLSSAAVSNIKFTLVFFFVLLNVNLSPSVIIYLYTPCHGGILLCTFYHICSLQLGSKMITLPECWSPDQHAVIQTTKFDCFGAGSTCHSGLGQVETSSHGGLYSLCSHTVSSN